jgi:sigma-B regulation protein RsbU (phosphoserine phosphatase)
LCVVEGFAYPSARRSLERGETLYVVTDGVTEAMNGAGAFYGAARLRAVLGKEADVAAVREDVQRFAGGAEQADDVTLLCVRWNGPASD